MNGMGFGVVIGTADNIVIRSQGHLRTQQTSPPAARCEYYGVLAAMTMIRHNLQYHNVGLDSPITIRLLCDNEGVIKRINRHRIDMVSKDFLLPDIDVEMQILEELTTLQSLGVRMSLQHVKGHQNNNQQTAALSHEAELNVVADLLARDSLSLPSFPEEQIIFPSNPIRLIVNNTHVVAHHKSLLRSAHLSPPLRQHFIKKYKWHNEVPSLIWWNIHDAAIKKLSHIDRPRIQKFIHNRWPTCHRETKYREHIKDECTACGSLRETEDHILQCGCESRHLIRQEGISTLQAELIRLQTPSAIQVAIIHGITAWLSKTPLLPIQLLVTNASPSLASAYDTQKRIGWDHFIRGRIALHWSSLIAGNQTTKTVWGTAIISNCWSMVLRLWSQRNNEYHGADLQDQAEKLHHHTLQEALLLLSQDAPVAPSDRDMTQISEQSLKDMTIHGLRCWIRNTKILSKAFQRNSPHSRPRRDRSRS
jgi:hypothetical protein